MDMSKLPRLSQTDTPPPPPPEETVSSEAAPQPVLPYAPADRAVYGAEAFIAVIVGVIFTFLGARFGSYLLSIISHKPFHTGVIFTSTGAEVPYSQLSPGHPMINEAGMFLFGLAMLLDAAVIATANASPRLRRPLLSVALVTTTLAVLFNVYVAAVFFKDGALPLFSLLAVGIGGYSAMIQWAMFKTVPAAARR